MARTSIIIGGDSQLGGALAARLTTVGDRVIVTTRRMNTLTEKRRPLDLELLSADNIPDADVAYLCAGVTSLQSCHRHPERTWRLNVEAAVELAETLIRRGTFVAFLSTNLVFDGSIPHVCAEAERRPMTVYGQQKAEAERRLIELGSRIAVVRLSKVLPRRYPLFQSWHRQIIERQSVLAFTDLSIAPVPIKFAVEMIGAIGTRSLSGIWQASAREQTSYYEIARRLADRTGGDNKLVSGVSAIDFKPLNGVVPAYVTLDTSRISTDLGMSVPDVWSTIDGNLDQIIDRSREEPL